MTTTHPDPDPFLRLMAGLTTHEPDAAHAERTRARCHRAMKRRRKHVSRPGWASGARWPRLIEATVVATMSALYLAEVFRRALQLLGF